MKTATTKTAPLFLRKFGPLLGAIAFYALIMILRSADIINGYYMQVMLFAGVNVMMTASLNLVNGFTGQFCIGHAGFMSLGAYGSAVITTLVFKGTSVAPAAQIPVFLLGLLCGGIVAALVGCLIGIPSLKLKGDYLAIVTLAFGEIVRALLRLRLYLFNVDGPEFTITVQHLTVYHGQANVRALSRIDHVAGGIGHRRELRRIGIDDAQVGLISNRQLAAVRASLRERTGARCGVQHLRRRQQRRIVIETLVDHAEQVHILHDVQIVVGRRAVRAERDIDALLQHFRNVRVAGCQLEIACRTAGDRNIVLLEDIEILVLQPDAVCRRGRRIENAVRLHVGRGRHAVALLALLMLGLRLAEGISEADFRTRFGVDFWATRGAVCESLLRAGLARRPDGRFALTESGWLVSNAILADLV